MSSKTDVEVIIGGKVFTLSGYESEEYLQKVASYINNKMNEYNKVDAFRRQPFERQSVLLQLNIADDYFKVKKSKEETDREYSEKQKENVDLKREIIGLQAKLETFEQENRVMKEENLELTDDLFNLIDSMYDERNEN